MPANHDPTMAADAPAARASATSLGRGCRRRPTRACRAPAAAAHRSRPTSGATHTGHHAHRAHRAGPDARLDDVGAPSMRSRCLPRSRRCPRPRAPRGTRATASTRPASSPGRHGRCPTSRTSTPASRTASALAATSPMIPMAAPMRRRPLSSTAGCRYSERRAPTWVNTLRETAVSSSRGASSRLVDAVARTPRRRGAPAER